MNLQDFDFALFIKDESAPEAELKNRTVLYQSNDTNYLVIARRNMRLIHIDAEEKQGR